VAVLLLLAAATAPLVLLLDGRWLLCRLARQGV
jgi:hypothetical protein